MKLMQVCTRRLAPGDERLLVAVAAAHKSAQVSIEYAAQLLANPAHYLLVAESAGRLLGFVWAYRLERIDQRPAQLFVYEVDVAADARRCGVGMRLMTHVREIVAAEGLHEAFVLTGAGNLAAQALYAKTGARRDEELSVVYIYPGAEHGDPMEKG
ncbi:MAG TPA: GNAT family N-acetyltransferase [Polyangia bacterium]|jgi:ribosomal protein S18 acetylase RimI-like enzyme|nr:GNAT family N-acetyltransferase [Polyangia bacterium]